MASDELDIERFKLKIIHECRSGETINGAVAKLMSKHNCYVVQAMGQERAIYFTGYNLEETEPYVKTLYVYWTDKENQPHTHVITLYNRQLRSILEKDSRWCNLAIE